MVFSLLEGIMGMFHHTQSDECGAEEKIKVSLLMGILTNRLSNLSCTDTGVDVLSIALRLHNRRNRAARRSGGRPDVSP